MLVPAMPLLGTLIIGFGRRKFTANTAGGLATVLVALSFVLTLVLFLGHHGERHIVHLFNWITVGEMQVPFAFQIDAQSLWMMLFITGGAALSHG